MGPLCGKGPHSPGTWAHGAKGPCQGLQALPPYQPEAGMFTKSPGLPVGWGPPGVWARRGCGAHLATFVLPAAFVLCHRSAFGHRQHSHLGCNVQGAALREGAEQGSGVGPALEGEGLRVFLWSWDCCPLRHVTPNSSVNGSAHIFLNICINRPLPPASQGEADHVAAGGPGDSLIPQIITAQSM